MSSPFSPEFLLMMQYWEELNVLEEEVFRLREQLAVAKRKLKLANWKMRRLKRANRRLRELHKA